MFNYALAIADARRFNKPEPVTFTVLDKWASFLPGRAGNVTSQFGEDGLLAALFERIGIRNYWCFEVGAWDGLELSNTWALREAGWQAVLIEADGHSFQELERRFRGTAILVHERINGSSLDRILSVAGAPADIDLGVIDIDGGEEKIWQGLIQFRPRVLLVEFNSAGDGMLSAPHNRWQAGRDTIEAVGILKGYRPLLSCGVNLLFVAEEVLTSLKSK